MMPLLTALSSVGRASALYAPGPTFESWRADKYMPDSEFKIEFATAADVPGILAVQESVLLANKDLDQGPGKSGFIALRVSKESIEQAVADNGNDFFLAVAKNEGGNVIGYFLTYDMDKWLELHREWMAETGIDLALIKGNKVMYGKHLASNRTIPKVGRALDTFLYKFAQERGYNLFIAEICEEPVRNRKSIDLHTAEFDLKRIGENKGPHYTFGVYAKDL